MAAVPPYDPKYLNVDRIYQNTFDKNIDLSKSEKAVFNNFEGFDSYSYCTDYLYSKNGCGVVFDKNKL